MNTRTFTHTGPRITHLFTLFTWSFATHALTSFLVELETLCALRLNVCRIASTLTLQRIPTEVWRAECWSRFALAATVFFRVLLGPFITVCRFDFASAGAGSVVRHSDRCEFVWNFFQPGLGGRPSNFAYHKVQIIFSYKEKRSQRL